MLGLSLCSHISLEKLDIKELISALPFGSAEQERLREISNQTAHISSLAALTALKRLTEGYNADTDLTVLRTKLGKPYFASMPLHFGLTHSLGLSAAVISDRNVGIDLEFLREHPNAKRISARFFASEEQKEIEAADDSTDAFFSIWTKKEAFAKLDGRGLSVLSELDAKNCFFRVFRLAYNESNAILTLAFNEPNYDEIFIICDDNIKIQEQQI